MYKKIVIMTIIVCLLLIAGCGKEASNTSSVEQSSSKADVQAETEETIAKPTKTEYGLIDEDYMFTMKPLNCYDSSLNDYREVNYTFRKANECKYGWDSNRWGNAIGGQYLGGSTRLSRVWSYDLPVDIPIWVYVLVPDENTTPAATLEEAEEALIPQISGLKYNFGINLFDVDNFYTSTSKEKITTRNGIEMLKVDGIVANPNIVDVYSYEDNEVKLIEFTAYYFLDGNCPIGILAIPDKVSEDTEPNSNQTGMYKCDKFNSYLEQFIQNVTKGIQENDVAELKMGEPEKETAKASNIEIPEKYNSGGTPSVPNSPEYEIPKKLYSFKVLDTWITVGESKYGEISDIVTPITEAVNGTFYVRVNDTKVEIKLAVQTQDTEHTSLKDSIITGFSVKSPQKVTNIVNWADGLFAITPEGVLDEIGLTKEDVFISYSGNISDWTINYCDMKLTGYNPPPGKGSYVIAITGNERGITCIKVLNGESGTSYNTSISKF